MKTKSIFLLIALTLLAVLLSSCSSGAVSTNWPGLAASADTAYLSNGTSIYAIRLKDGQQVWTFPEKVDTKLIFYANPVFTSDGQLIVGSSGSNHTIYRIDPQTGKDTWSFSAAKDHWVATPLVVGETVYAPNADGNLYVFDLTNATRDELAWSVTLGGRLWSQPATDGKLIYVASLNRKLYAVDPQTKAIAWELELDGAIAGSPTVSTDGKLLYVGSFGTTLEAVDLASKKVAWTAKTESWVWGGPVQDGNTIFFGDLTGNVYSLNASDGSTAFPSVKPDGPILASPIFLNGQVIFVTESATVYSMKPGETPQIMETLDGKIYTAPVSSGDLVLVAPFQGTNLLVALDKDGKQVWAFSLKKK